MSADAFAHAQGRAIVEALQHVLDDKDNANRALGEAIEMLVALRDGLIERKRAGELCGEWLVQANALISTIIGTEFPINGFQWNRVCETRDALKRMLGAA